MWHSLHRVVQGIVPIIFHIASEETKLRRVVFTKFSKVSSKLGFFKIHTWTAFLEIRDFLLEVLGKTCSPWQQALIYSEQGISSVAGWTEVLTRPISQWPLLMLCIMLQEASHIIFISSWNTEARGMIKKHQPTSNRSLKAALMDLCWVLVTLPVTLTMTAQTYLEKFAIFKEINIKIRKKI